MLSFQLIDRNNAEFSLQIIAHCIPRSRTIWTLPSEASRPPIDPCLLLKSHLAFVRSFISLKQLRILKSVLPHTQETLVRPPLQQNWAGKRRRRRRKERKKKLCWLQFSKVLPNFPRRQTRQVTIGHQGDRGKDGGKIPKGKSFFTVAQSPSENVSFFAFFPCTFFLGQVIFCLA